MWKRYMVLISGAALALSLPMAAQAVTIEGDDMDTDDPYTPAETRDEVRDQDRIRDVDPVPAEDQLQMRTEAVERQRLRVHLDTDPPADFDPVQTQLQTQTRLGTGNPDVPMGDPDAPRGNPDAPMLGDGSGECANDGERIGDGPSGPKGPNKG
jgi:hypothetical protein